MVCGVGHRPVRSLRGVEAAPCSRQPPRHPNQARTSAIVRWGEHERRVGTVLLEQCAVEVRWCLGMKTETETLLLLPTGGGGGVAPPGFPGRGAFAAA